MFSCKCPQSEGKKVMKQWRQEWEPQGSIKNWGLEKDGKVRVEHSVETYLLQWDKKEEFLWIEDKLGEFLT